MRKRQAFWAVGICAVMLSVTACKKKSSPAAPVTPPAPTATFTAVFTSTATQTFTVTSSPTSTFSPTPTLTSTLSATPTHTFTDTLTRTFTPTPTATRTFTVTSTPTDTDTPTHTFTVTNTPTDTLTPTVTDTPTITHTPTVTYTFTSTYTPTVTRTPCSSSVTFGNTTNDTLFYPYYTGYNMVYYSDYVPASSGTLSYVTLNVAASNSSPASFQVAVYTVDGSGNASGLVAVSGIQAVTTSNAYVWTRFPMPAASLSAGTTYALAAWYGGTCCGLGPSITTRYPGNVRQGYLTGADLTSPPTTFTTFNYNLSIYAEVCP